VRYGRERLGFVESPQQAKQRARRGRRLFALRFASGIPHQLAQGLNIGVSALLEQPANGGITFVDQGVPPAFATVLTGGDLPGFKLE
jgi:hypothetical protein